MQSWNIFNCFSYFVFYCCAGTTYFFHYPRFPGASFLHLVLYTIVHEIRSYSLLLNIFFPFFPPIKLYFYYSRYIARSFFSIFFSRISISFTPSLLDTSRSSFSFFLLLFCSFSFLYGLIFPCYCCYCSNCTQ